MASKDYPLVPEQYREKPVFPNIAIPRHTKQNGVKHVMNNVEILWLYKHAGRGAGLYYRKGDHVISHGSLGA